MRQIISHPLSIRLLGLMLGLVLGVSSFAFAADTGATSTVPDADWRYSDPDFTLEQAIAIYHKNINDLFNKKMALLAKGKGDNTVPNQGENVLFQDAVKACPDDNVTTYCVSLLALKEFDGFGRAMQQRGLQLFDASDTATTFTPSIALVNQAIRQNAIDLEVQVAEQALYRTLAAYNELHSAYPLHQAYEKVMDDLIKYRDSLAKVRDEIEQYPSKLIDASTPSCG